MSSWCPQCGPNVEVDEDGCCAGCGATAMGPGADGAHKLKRTLEGLVGASTRPWYGCRGAANIITCPCGLKMGPSFDSEYLIRAWNRRPATTEKEKPPTEARGRDQRSTRMWCDECLKMVPSRYAPSPDAGPHWRCSECGEVTTHILSPMERSARSAP